MTVTVGEVLLAGQPVQVTRAAVSNEIKAYGIKNIPTEDHFAGIALTDAVVGVDLDVMISGIINVKFDRSSGLQLDGPNSDILLNNATSGSSYELDVNSESWLTRQFHFREDCDA